MHFWPNIANDFVRLVVDIFTWTENHVHFFKIEIESKLWNKLEWLRNMNIPAQMHPNILKWLLASDLLNCILNKEIHINDTKPDHWTIWYQFLCHLWINSISSFHNSLQPITFQELFQIYSDAFVSVFFATIYIYSIMPVKRYLFIG